MSEVLDKPLKILKDDHHLVLEKSGIKDWREDLDHLKNQYCKDQIGSLDGIDKKQKKRDK